MIKLYLERSEFMYKGKSIKQEIFMLIIMVILTFTTMFVILYKGYKNQNIKPQIEEKEV